MSTGSSTSRRRTKRPVRTPKTQRMRGSRTPLASARRRSRTRTGMGTCAPAGRSGTSGHRTPRCRRTSRSRLTTTSRRILGALRSGEFANVSWPFTPASVGRYIVSVRVDLGADEIPENNERLSHFTAHLFSFVDDIEAGVGTWTTLGQSSDDQHRWQIVDDTDAYGSSHSPTHAWRFGFFPTTLPNLFPPVFHYLQSGPITVPAGPVYLLYYQRYDLWGRSESPVIINPAETDHGYTEVSVNGGPWVAVAHAQGRNLRR